MGQKQPSAIVSSHGSFVTRSGSLIYTLCAQASHRSGKSKAVLHGFLGHVTNDRFCADPRFRLITINRTVESIAPLKDLGNSTMSKPAPNTENRTVPIRKPNSKLRSREYLTVKEVERLMETARKNRRGHRDATMILLAFRHGLRPSEVCALK